MTLCSKLYRSIWSGRKQQQLRNIQYIDDDDDSDADCDGYDDDDDDNNETMMTVTTTFS